MKPQPDWQVGDLVQVMSGREKGRIGRLLEWRSTMWIVDLGGEHQFGGANHLLYEPKYLELVEPTKEMTNDT